jgi:hypothetical protein
MAHAENIQLINKMPTPGNISHLDYLATLESSSIEAGEFADFLALTQATRSIGLFITRLRTYLPIRTPYIDFDSRQIDEDKLLYRFTGSVYRNPNDPALGHLSLAGEKKLKSGDQVYSYGALIPTHFDLTHDPSRPAEAVFMNFENGRQERTVFNEAADPDDFEEEHIPLAAVEVIQFAARDLLKNLGYTPGKLKRAPDRKPTPKDRMVWHPDYLSDDPDEFLKAT